MPFAGYEDFADCVRQNQDKDDPEAYCARIQQEAEGEESEMPATTANAQPRVNEKNLVERKNVVLQDAKFDEQAGTFEGYAAVFNEKDLQNDVIREGAFRKTISDNGGLFVMLDQHQIDREIGLIRAQEDSKGLKIRGEFYVDENADPAKELRLARDVYVKMQRRQQAGKPLQFSIGYRAINPRFEKGTRILEEIGLAEVSSVTFPAAPSAVTTGVKNQQAIDLKDFGPEFDRAVEQEQAFVIVDVAVMFLFMCLDKAFFDFEDGAEAEEYLANELNDFSAAVLEAVRTFYRAYNETSYSPEEERAKLEQRSAALRAMMEVSTNAEEPQKHSDAEAADDEGKAALLRHLAEMKQGATAPAPSPAPRELAEDLREKARKFRARATAKE